eukprot:scaffold360_cov374-Pavlova_lutheri.AAC.81
MEITMRMRAFAPIRGANTARNRSMETQKRSSDGQRRHCAGEGESCCTAELLDALVPPGAWHTKQDSKKVVLELQVQKQQKKIDMLEKRVEDLLLCALETGQNGQADGSHFEWESPPSATRKNTAEEASKDNAQERIRKLEIENKSLRRRDAMRTEFVRQSRELIMLQLKKSGQVLEEVQSQKAHSLSH